MPNGFEGQAYTDVLLDVLQADDDDDDLLNGRPTRRHHRRVRHPRHPLVQLRGVGAHPGEFTPAETTVTVEAEANIVFPYVTYFDSMRLHYRLTPSAPWTVVPMGQTTTCSPTTFLVAAGTVIEYYIDILMSLAASARPRRSPTRP